MSEDVATLADTVVAPSAPDTTTTPAVTTATPEPVATAQPTVNTDALEIGEILLGSGYTKEQINDLLTAPQTLNQIRYQLENDPAQFLRELERNNPKVGERVMESITDMYVERYGERGKPAAQPTAPSNDEVTALRARLDQLERERAGERQAASLAATRQRYQGRVDDLFGLKEVKDLGLTKAEVKAMRASLDVELGKDAGATQRIINGNFVDVPKMFKGILDEWVADKRAAVDAAKTARETQQRAANFEFESGPMGIPKEVGDAISAELDKVW